MNKIAIKYGVFLFASFVGLFLLMHEVAQIRDYNLRALNAFAHLGLIYGAIRQYRRENPDSVNNYVSGVVAGMYASIIGVLPFTAFVMFYLIGDTAFMNYIQDTIPIGTYLNPFTASLFVLTEGIAVSLIGSYIVTRVIDMNLVRSNPDLQGEYHD
ncbi:hypothetical protein [Phaeodactylibacter luteus]|uniref:DUF4199 domain-containing protein n=1 Tax=Phaeodactylibacter luteus TaxID=1564516 RepID=A0A5C6RNZ9_9BACT|nr:hypothetical protein [Phaeodactylibacter luteus]TXB63380.1 hypothetical protein FRY97_09420 [Phaeodactylibacter luteus]